MRSCTFLFLSIAACGRTCDGRKASRGDAAPSLPPVDDMVLVPAGPFLMGDPPHEVVLEAFALDRTEVTQGDYDRCVAAGICNDIPSLKAMKEHPPPRHPVVNVTPDEAATYCAWLGKQLPTEAQWEKAARGVDGRTYPWGEEPPTCERALLAQWTATGTDACGVKDALTSTHPVGAHPAGASPYGALDMAGNVYEWTADFEAEYHVIRSGRLRGDKIDELRAAYRNLVIVLPPSEDPEYRMWQNRHPFIGFRCVRNPRGRELSDEQR